MKIKKEYTLVYLISTRKRKLMSNDYAMHFLDAMSLKDFGTGGKSGSGSSYIIYEPNNFAFEWRIFVKGAKIEGIF